jgi:6-phosphogluconolactonase
MNSDKLHIYFTPAQLAQSAADRIADFAERAISQTGRFILGLAGGTTPRLTYELLTDSRYKRIIDWNSVHIFWGDERCVPPNHPDSNYHMAKTALLDLVDIPATRIHRIQGEINPQKAADQYERELRDYFQGRLGIARARFDLLLLGLGADGHTASLFPGTPAIRETQRWTAAQHIDQLNAWRITLTPPAINAAKTIMFLVTGSDKAEAVQKVLTAPYQPDAIPAQIVRPDDGNVIWMLDNAAAALIRPSES